MNLSSQQMLSLWRSRAGIDSDTASCTIRRVDGIDVDTYLRRRMRAWYVHLLDHAPLSQLVITDRADEATITPASEHQAAVITTTEAIRRPVSIRLASWTLPATVTSENSFSSASLSHPPLHNPYAAPVAVLRADGTILVAPCAPSDTVASLMAVADDGPDTYTIQESALATIPDALAD